ncbi:hypothetical protein D3C81_1940900 [compost metagenome]
MPTAVITESRENTMSMMAIWMMVAMKLRAAPLGTSSVSSSPSRLWYISVLLFHSRNRPPKKRIRSRPEMPWPNRSNRSLVSRMIQVIDSSRAMRVTIASARPKKRVRACR